MLAYTQALQYWVEKANPPMPGQPCLLVRCVQELRQVMKPYVAFTDDTILEGAAPWKNFPQGQTQAPISVETLAAPTTEEPTPAKEPTKELVPTEGSTKEAAPKEEPTEEPPTPMAPTEKPTVKLAISMATVREPAEEPDIPLCCTRREKKGKFHVATSLAGQKCCIPPSW